MMSITAADIIELMKARRLRLVTVESCTGGMVFSELTSVSGASAVLDRGFITYSNQAKQEMVGVSPETLLHYGAVSEQTAAEMASGGLTAGGQADIAISITGIAGPDGGSMEKPVGLVYIGRAIHAENSVEAVRTDIFRHQFAGDRQTIRQAAMIAAFGHIQQYGDSI